MIVRTAIININSTCQHCGQLWGIGEDYKRVLTFLPSPRRAGTYRVPCLACRKKNPVTIEIREVPQ